MRLRRRLVATMIALVAVGLAVVNVVTLTSLQSYLDGRLDDQLATVSVQTVALVQRATVKHFTITPSVLATHISPDLFVALRPSSGPTVVRLAESAGQVIPPPVLPSPLPIGRTSPSRLRTKAGQAYRPNPSSVNVPAVGGHGPEYRLEAVSVPGGTLVVAASLASTDATIDSLRTIELAVSAVLLVALGILMTVLIRLGLRPLEDMAKEADAIAAGDLTRRVQPTDGEGEIARLGRALNGMLAQIETAFAQRTLSEERLRSFLADASHELRTPLTSIRGYAELLQKDALTDEASRAKALARIEREAARMGALVGDLGILARQDDGPEPVLHRVDLAVVAADVVADARVIDDTHRIELSAPSAVPVAADDARLEQMVHNLLGNALAHTPAGTPVEVVVSVRGDQAVLRVTDRGPGMSEDQASRVFDRFYRGEGARIDGGSGLGLFIVATLAESFGGRATVDTAIGEGATFEVVLPLYGSERLERSERSGSPGAGGPPPGHDGDRIDSWSADAGGSHASYGQVPGGPDAVHH
jgi:two-component system OmpR family sensor kinase